MLEKEIVKKNILYLINMYFNTCILAEDTVFGENW